MTFDDFINFLDNNEEKRENIISVLIGDIQRIAIYPQFGWQIENEIPDKVIDAYNYLKNIGYNKYIIPKDTIEKLLKDNGKKINEKTI